MINIQSIITSLLLIFLVVFCSNGLSQEEYKAGEKVGPSIKDILEKSLPPNPDRVISVDPKTGTIVVRDTPSNQRRIEEILKEIDIGPQQISIESRFVELKATDLTELGVNWGNTFLWYDYSSGAPIGQRKVEKKITGGQTPGSQGNLVLFPLQKTEGLSLSIARLKPIELDIILNALAKSDKANLLSSPKVTTINGQKANIQITRSVPYVKEVKTSNVGSASAPIWKYDYTVVEEEVGITLVVTPRVGEDSKIITLELEPEVEVLACRLTFVVTNEDLGWPVIDRRNAKTTVMVQSGETVILGGLIDDRDEKTLQKVPILGDIPLLGNLFRHYYTNRVKKNLLIFVTAALINPEGAELTD